MAMVPATMREARKSPTSPNTSAVPRRMRSPKRAPALPRTTSVPPRMPSMLPGKVLAAKSPTLPAMVSMPPAISQAASAPRVALHDEFARAHAAADVVADVALDMQPTAVHLPADAVEPRSGRPRTPAPSSPRASTLKNSASGTSALPWPTGSAFDLGRRQRGQRRRRHAAQVDRAAPAPACRARCSRSCCAPGQQLVQVEVERPELAAVVAGRDAQQPGGSTAV